MALKNVLKTYSLLRSLSDNESALLETLRSLNDSEREQLVETMAPTKAVKKPIPRCVECGLAKESITHRDQKQADYHEFRLRKKREAKSSHAQSLSSAIQRVPKGKVEDADIKPRCAFMLDGNSGELCEAVEDDPIHDLTYSSSHEFVAETAKAASGD